MVLRLQALHRLPVHRRLERLQDIPDKGWIHQVAEAVDDALAKEQRWILPEVEKGEPNPAARLDLEGSQHDVPPPFRVGSLLEEAGQVAPGRGLLEATGWELGDRGDRREVGGAPPRSPRPEHPNCRGDLGGRRPARGRRPTEPGSPSRPRRSRRPRGGENAATARPGSARPPGGGPRRGRPRSRDDAQTRGRQAPRERQWSRR